MHIEERFIEMIAQSKEIIKILEENLFQESNFNNS